MREFIEKNFKTIMFILSLVLILILVLLWIDIFFTTENKSGIFYKQGTHFLNKGDYQNAYYNYSKIKPTSKYYPIALYRQAWCANTLEDKTTAIQKYNIFIKKYTNSVFTPKAHFEMGRNLYLVKNYVKSKKTFLDIQQKYPNTDYAIGTNYFLGLIQKQINDNSLQTASSYFAKYIEYCPNCKYTQQCIKEITDSNEILPQNVYSEIGKALYLNQRYNEAITYLQRGTKGKYWNYIFLSFVKSNNPTEAKKIFEQNYINNSKQLSQDEVEAVISYYATIQNTNNRELYKKLDTITAQNHLACRDFILYKLALLAPTETEKIFYYKLLLQQYPTSRYAPELSWSLFKILIKDKKISEAVYLGEKHLRLYSSSKSAPAVIFWLARTYNRNNQEIAKTLFKKLLTEYTDDYYAFRAASILKKSEYFNAKLLQATNEETILPPLDLTDWSDNDKLWIAQAIELDDTSILDDINTNNKIITSWILYKKGQIPVSSVYARDWLGETKNKPIFNSIPYKLAYPILYKNYIIKNADKMRLNEYLILALIKEESHFNESIKSEAGATGLMQIMPQTAQYIAQQRNIRDYNESYLNIPEYNILIGCNYFDYLKKNLHNSDLLAVTAYNGGPQAVSNWLNDKDYSDFDEFVENIPFPETQNYVKKVYKTYWNYLNIYKK